MKIRSIETIDVKSKLVLFRPDINSPINEKGEIVNMNRLERTLPTLNYLLDGKARVAIIAHQGDVLDYANLTHLKEHAKALSKLTGKKIGYIDDVCGDAAIERIKHIKEGEALILGNLRYLSEEMSSFEDYVKLDQEQMSKVYHVRRLAPLFDLYVNDAFSAAHRASPSMIGFQSLLPSAAGFLFFKEYSMLKKMLSDPQKPVTFIFGGAKVSDSFSIMGKILNEHIADCVLACGLLGQLLLVAQGKYIGDVNLEYLKNKNILSYLPRAEEIMQGHGEKIFLPVDFSYLEKGQRKDVAIAEIGRGHAIMDIGPETVRKYSEKIMQSKTLFYNGPAGVYENKGFELGTKGILDALKASKGFSIVGGGDTVRAVKELADPDSFGYVSTAGGAMIQFLSGKKLPLITAMENAKPFND